MACVRTASGSPNFEDVDATFESLSVVGSWRVIPTTRHLPRWPSGPVEAALVCTLGLPYKPLAALLCTGEALCLANFDSESCHTETGSEAG